MKDLGASKQILGLSITRDKVNGTLKLSQTEYVKKVLSKFNMNEAKPISTPLGNHFGLSKDQSLKTEQEMDHMSKVPYDSTIGGLMYAMVCTRPNIAHAMGVVSRYISRPGKLALGPLGNHFGLSKDQSLKTEQEMDHMSKVPYDSTTGGLMYAIVCTRPNIAHAMGVVSRYISRPGKLALGSNQVDSQVSERFTR